MYCKDCGSEIVDAGTFCDQCGSRVVAEIRPSVEKVRDKPSVGSRPQGIVEPMATELTELALPVRSSPQSAQPGRKGAPRQIVGHWSQLLENLQYSPMSFYASLEEAIKKREMPDVTMIRVDWQEGGVFSSKREYLRVSRKRHVIDICGAPFGNGFFVSYWLGVFPAGHTILMLLGIAFGSSILWLFMISQFGFFLGVIGGLFGIPILLLLVGYIISEGVLEGEETILETPVLGFLYDRIFQPHSYYKIDMALMFHAAVRKAVMDVIDEISEAKGLRKLTELERKPVMKEFFQR